MPYYKAFQAQTQKSALSATSSALLSTSSSGWVNTHTPLQSTAPEHNGSESKTSTSDVQTTLLSPTQPHSQNY